MGMFISRGCSITTPIRLPIDHPIKLQLVLPPEPSGDLVISELELVLVGDDRTCQSATGTELGMCFCGKNTCTVPYLLGGPSSAGSISVIWGSGWWIVYASVETKP